MDTKGSCCAQQLDKRNIYLCHDVHGHVEGYPARSVLSGGVLDNGGFKPASTNKRNDAHLMAVHFRKELPPGVTEYLDDEIE